jgi:centromere/kinetochore protein ZW10
MSPLLQQEIRILSREAAPDVDDWISQAKQLHADIERSRVTAREIVIQHDKGHQLRKQAAEAEQRLKQLQDEISFTETVSSAYEEIGALRSTLVRAHEALVTAEHHRAFELLRGLENRLEATFLPRDTHALRIFASKCSDLRNSISDDLRRQWTKFVEIDHHTAQMVVASGDASESDVFILLFRF